MGLEEIQSNQMTLKMSDKTLRENLIFSCKLEELPVEIICLIFEYLPEIYRRKFKETTKKIRMCYITFPENVYHECICKIQIISGLGNDFLPILCCRVSIMKTCIAIFFRAKIGSGRYAHLPQFSLSYFPA